MAINVCSVTPSFAAEIGDIDLSGSLEPANLAAIKDAFTTYAVLFLVIAPFALISSKIGDSWKFTRM